MIIILLHTEVFWRKDKSTRTTKLYKNKVYKSIKIAKQTLNKEKRKEYKNDYWDNKEWSEREKKDTEWIEYPSDDVIRTYEFVKLENYKENEKI